MDRFLESNLILQRKRVRRRPRKYRILSLLNLPIIRRLVPERKRMSIKRNRDLYTLTGLEIFRLGESAELHGHVRRGAR